MIPSYRTTYSLDQLSREYKAADIEIKETELVTDIEVYAVVSKVIPALYLGFFVAVVILSGVLSQ